MFFKKKKISAVVYYQFQRDDNGVKQQVLGSAVVQREGGSFFDLLQDALTKIKTENPNQTFSITRIEKLDV